MDSNYLWELAKAIYIGSCAFSLLASFLLIPSWRSSDMKNNTVKSWHKDGIVQILLSLIPGLNTAFIVAIILDRHAYESERYTK